MGTARRGRHLVRPALRGHHRADRGPRRRRGRQVGGTNCVAPFTLPDIWNETSNEDRNPKNRGEDGNETWNFDPEGRHLRCVQSPVPGGGQTGFGSNLRNGVVGTNDYTGDLGARSRSDGTDGRDLNTYHLWTVRTHQREQGPDDLWFRLCVGGVQRTVLFREESDNPRDRTASIRRRCRNARGLDPAGIRTGTRSRTRRRRTGATAAG